MSKIIIAGIGGVGGYFGGLLAKHYESTPGTDIVFYARGEHLSAIQKNGLKVIQGDATFVAHPRLATDDAAGIGTADAIIFATKSYDLEAVLHALAPCINKHTLLLPLLNGVDSTERIKTAYPNNTVLEGCTYIVSRIQQPGVIQNSGNIQKLYFGGKASQSQLDWLLTLFTTAQCDAYLIPNIQTVVWEKFVFISPIATATAYFDACIGEILKDPIRYATLKTLIDEIICLAKAKNIPLLDNQVDITVNKYKTLPFEATSSMHSDFRAKKQKTELATLTEYVIKEGMKHAIHMPNYQVALASLLKKIVN